MNNKLIILCGIPFSGKSVLAKEMEERLGYVRVDLDEVKFGLFGKDIKDSQIEKDGWDKVFQNMYQVISKLLNEGKTVVHDTGNFTKYERSLVRKIADDLGIPILTIFVDTPKDVAYKRLLENRITKNRFDVDDVDFESSVKEMEIPGVDEPNIVYHSDEPVGEWISNNIVTGN